MTPVSDLPAPAEGSSFGVPARRERIIAILTEAYARNDLEQRVFEQRVEQAELCRTLEQLDALIADFPPEARERYGSADSPAIPGSAPVAALAPQEIERMVAKLDGESAPTRFGLIGDQHVTVRPADPRVVRSVVAIGDSHVDLRPLAGEGGVFLLKISSLIGDTRITVSSGTQVDIRAVTVIGDQTRKDKRKGGFIKRIGRKLGVIGDEEPEAPRGLPGPLVVVTGFKLIGDTVILEE